MAWFSSIDTRQIKNFHHQRLTDFLNEKGSAGNSVPRVWLRFTDISQVSLSRQHCRLTICIELVDLTVSDGKIQITILWKWSESDICEGRPLGGLFNTASAFYAHSMASHLRANRIHWLDFQFLFKPSGSPRPKMWFSSLHSAENCSGFSHPSLRKTAYDLDCRQKHSTVCQVPKSLLKIFTGWEKSLSRTQCLNFGWGDSALLLHLTPCTSCARIWVR